jgi:protein-L-isoaspartate(D-aspartate) O-methyltransferase
MNAYMDEERARFNMVQQQIRPWEVLDEEVLALLQEVRREEFVPEQHRRLAFADMEIPLGHGECMLAPKLEARMLQELAVKNTDRVLEIGTGSGYMTALLARRGADVYSVEIIPEFSSAAAAKLTAHGITNATLEIGDGARGWSKHAPYDVVLVTGSLPVSVPQFQQSLRPGGRMLAVIGQPPVMQARLITCVAPGAWNSLTLFESCIPPLKNARQPEKFFF